MPSSPQPLAVAPSQALSSEASKARLERMFNEHHDFIWRLLRRLYVSREKADDASQNVFLVATERVDSIQPGSERAFLFGTALRVARSQQRSERRWVLDDEMDSRRSEAPRPEALAEQRMAVDMMDRSSIDDGSGFANDVRPVRARRAFDPRDRPARGDSTGTAASRLRRAREHFRESVARYESEKKTTVRSST